MPSQKIHNLSGYLYSILKGQSTASIILPYRINVKPIFEPEGFIPHSLGDGGGFHAKISHNMSLSRIVSALVFSRKNIGEADRLVTFFTKEEGLIRVIAKGVRKIPSARGGHLEPCTMVSVTLNESRARNLQAGGGGEVFLYAGKIETEEYFHALREDADSFARACGHIRFFSTLFETGQAAPDIFDALVDAWREYPVMSHAKRIVMDASLSLQMIHAAGIVPDMRLWNTNISKDRTLALLKYLTENPSHASRIALSDEDASLLHSRMKELIARTTMVYS